MRTGFDAAWVSAIAVYLAVLSVGVAARFSEAIRQAIPRQRWLTPLLAVTAVLLAMWQFYEGVRVHAQGGLRLAGCVVAGLILAGLVGRMLPLQRWINSEVQDAGGRLGQLGVLPIGSALRLLLVLLVLNPVGWLAAVAVGVTGDARLLTWKAVLDGATLLGLPRGARGALLVAALVSTAFHGLVAWVALAGRAFLEARGLVGVFLVASGLVWVTVPLLLFRLRPVPLGNMAMAVVLACGVGWFWR